MVEIEKKDSGECQLHFKSSSGNVLLKSIAFKTEDEAKNILKETMARPVFERKTQHGGKFVISLMTGSGKQVGFSNTYSSEAGMENGIKNLRNSLLQSS